jgi:hypothetical protein
MNFIVNNINCACMKARLLAYILHKALVHQQEEVPNCMDTNEKFMDTECNGVGD